MAVNEIYRHFDCQFSEGSLHSWGDLPGNNDFPCIDISNQYLTPAKEAQGSEDMPFHKSVGPQGILQSMTKGNGSTMHIYTEDNQVQYFSTKKDTEGNIKSVTHIVLIEICTHFVLDSQIHLL